MTIDHIFSTVMDFAKEIKNPYFFTFFLLGALSILYLYIKDIFGKSEYPMQYGEIRTSGKKNIMSRKARLFYGYPLFLFAFTSGILNSYY